MYLGMEEWARYSPPTRWNLLNKNTPGHKVAFISALVQCRIVIKLSNVCYACTIIVKCQSCSEVTTMAAHTLFLWSNINILCICIIFRVSQWFSVLEKRYSHVVKSWRLYQQCTSLGKNTQNTISSKIVIHVQMDDGRLAQDRHVDEDFVVAYIGNGLFACGLGNALAEPFAHRCCKSLICWLAWHQIYYYMIRCAGFIMLLGY